MKDIVRATLAGIAIGGFVAAVVEANYITLRALIQLNCFAMETACVMTKAVMAKILKEQQQENET